MNVSPSKTLNP